MPLDPNGPLTQYRAQIDANEAAIAQAINITEANENLGGAGFGGIGLTIVQAMAEINDNWLNITGWNQALLTNPRDVIQNFAGGGLQITKAGVWNCHVKLALSFIAFNAGRRIRMRIYNASKSTPAIEDVDFYVGRDQDGVNIIFDSLVEVPETALGDLYILQVRSEEDFFMTPVNQGSLFQAFYVDLYQGF